MRMIFKVILVALAVMAAMMFIKNQQVPKNLGVKEGKLSEVPDTPNGVSTQTTVIEKQVSPLAYKESLEASKEKLKKQLMAMVVERLLRKSPTTCMLSLQRAPCNTKMMLSSTLMMQTNLFISDLLHV